MHYLVVVRHVTGCGWSHSVKPLTREHVPWVEVTNAITPHHGVHAAMIFAQGQPGDGTEADISQQWLVSWGEVVGEWLMTGGMDRIRATVRVMIRERAAWEADSRKTAVLAN